MEFKSVINELKSDMLHKKWGASTFFMQIAVKICQEPFFYADMHQAAVRRGVEQWESLAAVRRGV